MDNDEIKRLRNHLEVNIYNMKQKNVSLDREIEDRVITINCNKEFINQTEKTLMVLDDLTDSQTKKEV